MPSSPEVCLTVCPHDELKLKSFNSHGSARLNLPDGAGPFFLRLLFSSFFLLLLSIANVPVTMAQSPTATLTGTVTDQNDAVIPGVNIAVISIAQGFQRSAVTDGDGAYLVPLLPPGNYTVKAEREGFTPAEVRDVVLNIYDRVNLRIQLKVGALSGQNVDIVDRPALIDESSAVATTVDRQFVENLPLNGRSFQSLITLSPGVVLTKTDFNEAGQFSVNGQRANANYFTVDGVSANIGAPTGLVPGQNGAGALPGLTTFGGTNNLVSVDAVQEFKILTSTYAPEYGRTPGAQVSLVTRSGSNDFHGSVFDYFRNDVLDSNDWFANSRRLRRPALRQNDFGGVLGGPIFLPRFGEGGKQPGYDGRNKTFFFFSYEGLRLRQPLVGITDVPSRSARTSATAPAAILQLLNAFPLPTGPDRANGFAEFAASFSNPTTLNATSLRIDHTLNSKLTFFGRFSFAPSQTVTRTGDGLRSLNNSRLIRVYTRTFTAAATWLINPAATNDFRFNYSRNSNGGYYSLDSFGGAVPVEDSLLFPSFSSPTTDLINVSLSSANFASFQVGNGITNVQRQINLVDNLSLVRASHQFKFGVDYRRLSPILDPRSYAQFVTFNGITSPTNGALSGRAQTVQLENNIGPQLPIVTNFSLYGQDNWKLNRRLTLTYGARWEVNPPPHEANGKSPYAMNELTAPTSISFAPQGTELWQTTFGNVAPRIGAAYQMANTPGRELMLRGGFGVFYDLGVGTILNSYDAAWPFSSRRSLTSVPFPLSVANATPAAIRTTPPTSSVVVLFDPHLKLPYTLQWNFAAEQSLGKNQTISVSYVGAAGRRLLRTETIRFGSAAFVNPNFGSSAIIATNAAVSDYRALQVQFERRLSRGLQVLAAYTFGRSIDTASNDSGENNIPDLLSHVSNDRGPSDFDVRHTFTSALTYNIPTPELGRVGRSILGNWGVDGLFGARSATPLNVTMIMSTTTYGLYFFRPNVVSGAPLYLNDPKLPGGRRVNPAAFALPTPGQNGNLPRNSLRGFSYWQLDLALRRQFNLTERVGLQFRAEAFNLLNHPNFGDPTDLNAGTFVQAANLFVPANATTFGVSTNMLGRRLGSGGNSGGFSPLYQIGGPRSIQLSMKLSF
jgi:outer membrane receptor protein involved in Fe transport